MARNPRSRQNRQSLRAQQRLARRKFLQGLDPAGLRGPAIQDLARYPVVPDFRVELEEFSSWIQAHFLGAGTGVLASFPLPLPVPGRPGPPAIPLGTLARPYDDLDQGYRVVIFEAGEFVHILEAGDDWETFHVYFKVQRQHYLEQWRLALGRRDTAGSPGA